MYITESSILLLHIPISYLKVLEIVINPILDSWKVAVLHFSECFHLVFPGFFEGIVGCITAALHCVYEIDSNSHKSMKILFWRGFLKT